jgi:adenylate kinase family enzyme
MTSGYNRIAIVGLPGSGKSTLSSSLSAILGLQHVELDAIHWLPNWASLERPAMTEQVDAACPPDGCWVVDGNYRVVRPMLWSRADTIVWLDFPLWLTMWRLLKRTLSRMFFNQKLWNGNQERWRNLFALNTADNLLLFALSRRSLLKAEVPVALRQPEYQHLKLLRFRHPKEVDDWLQSLKRDIGRGNGDSEQVQGRDPSHRMNDNNLAR